MLENKVAVVTGAGHPRGIGYAVCCKLAEYGASVYLTDIPAASEGLERGVETLRAQGCDADYRLMDVTDAEGVRMIVDEVADLRGGLDILVNNAGIGGGGSRLLDIRPEDFEKTLQVNLMGAFHCCRAVVPHMMASGGGSIINVASLCGLGAIPEIPLPYTSSKFAVIGLTKALALDLAEDNIRCNAVCPGAVNTSMRDQLFERVAEEQQISKDEARRLEDETIAMGRGGEPEEIADCVAYLAGDGAAYVTGTAIPVAGGMVPGL